MGNKLNRKKMKNFSFAGNVSAFLGLILSVLVALLPVGCGKKESTTRQDKIHPRDVSAETAEKTTPSPWTTSSRRYAAKPAELASSKRYGIDDRPDRGKSGTYVYRDWWIDPIAGTKPALEKLFAGISFYPDRELGIYYTQVYDKKNKQPVYRKFGDRFFSFKSVARSGWNFENFLGIILYDGKSEIHLREQFLLSSLIVMEPEGERAVADFVFKLKGENNYAGIRCVGYASKPTWLFCELYLLGKQYSFKRISLSSYGGYVGSRYPYRKIWFAGKSKHLEMNKTNAKLDMTEFESLLIHQKNATDNRGSLGVFDIASLNEMRSGYRGMGVRLFPRKGVEHIRFAISDYAMDDDDAIALMRDDAPKSKKFLKNIDWNIDLGEDIRFANKLKTKIGTQYLATPAGKKFLSNLAAIKRIKKSTKIKGRMKEIVFGQRLTRLMNEYNEVCTQAIPVLTEKQEK